MHGGAVCFGPFNKLVKDDRSLTGEYISGKRKIEIEKVIQLVQMSLLKSQVALETI